jgi:homoserine/homoserine lactone efflux protein
MQLFLTFALAVTVLMLIPGPNMALIVSNSVAHGTRYGLLTVVGTSSAMVVQLALTALGMTELLGTLGSWFEWIRWLGVAYLLYLGLKLWRAPPENLSGTDPARKAPRAIFMQAFLVSLTNPKTLLFYGAFFPQFIDPAANVGHQLALLTTTFLILAVLLDSTWALAAGRARLVLKARAKWRNRLSGGLLIGAGIGLAVARDK